MSDIIKKILH